MKEKSIVMSGAESPSSPRIKSGLRSKSLGPKVRRGTSRRIASDPSSFALAVRQTSKEEIDRLIEFYITHKYGEVNWNLCENLDGVNVFTSDKGTDFSATPNMITTKHAIKLFQQQNKSF